MIHDPLLKLDLLRQEAWTRPLTKVEWDSLRDDMNDAVCFFLRLQERGAFKGHEGIEQEIKAFLNSRDEP